MKTILTTTVFLFFGMAVFSQNLLVTTNTSFKEGTSGWEHGVTSIGDTVPVADFELVDSGQDDDKALQVKVKVPGDKQFPNQVYLKTSGIKLKKKKKYRLQFYVKSTEYADKVSVTLASGSVENLAILETREIKYKGDDQWIKVSFTFLCKPGVKSVDYKDLSLYLGFNSRFGKFYVDNFQILPMK